MDLDVNKIVAKLAGQISQLSIQNAALQAQVEAYEEIIKAQTDAKTMPKVTEPLSGRITQQPDVNSSSD